jgi:exodeoxyribonuclease-3
MRIITFCADGIQDAADRGFYEWVSSQDADFVCVQNLGAQEYELQADIFFPKDYNSYFFDSVKSNSNGVAIYSRELPKAIMTGLGFNESDMEGRYMQADFDNISIGSLLAPSAIDNSPEEQLKKTAFFEQFRSHLDKVKNKRREFIICGNWNIAHSAKDIENTAKASGQSGFLPEERQWMDEIFGLGYVDAFREINSDSDEFTWWPDGTREKPQDSNGWRVDYQIVSQGMKYTVEYGAAYKRQSFSNHAPLTMDYDFEL